MTIAPLCSPYHHHLRPRDSLEGIHMDRADDPTVGLITSKNWTLEHLLATGAKFRPVDRVSAASQTPGQIASTIKDYEQRNVPLVVQDLHCHPNWPEFFTPQWLESHYGTQGTCARTFLPKFQVSTSCIPVVQVRNVHGERLDRETTVTELIDNLRNAPPFADEGGKAYHFVHLRFPTDMSSRTRAFVRQGCALSVGVERLDQDFWCPT